MLAFSLVLAAIKFLTQKIEEPAQQDVYTPPAARSFLARVPWFAAAAALVSLLFLFFGGTFNTWFTNMVPVSSLEVRPSYASTMQIIGAARGSSFERLLVGTGPDTFGESWLLNKPAEVNQSVFWNLDFNVGFSSFITSLGTVGLLGVLAWLIPVFLVLAGLGRAIRLGVLSRDERVAVASIGIAEPLPLCRYHPLCTEPERRAPGAHACGRRGSDSSGARAAPARPMRRALRVCSSWRAGGNPRDAPHLPLGRICFNALPYCRSLCRPGP